jgi:hypothetical protein
MLVAIYKDEIYGTRVKTPDLSFQQSQGLLSRGKNRVAKLSALWNGDIRKWNIVNWPGTTCCKPGVADQNNL